MSYETDRAFFREKLSHLVPRKKLDAAIDLEIKHLDELALIYGASDEVLLRSLIMDSYSYKESKEREFFNYKKKEFDWEDQLIYIDARYYACMEAKRIDADNIDNEVVNEVAGYYKRGLKIPTNVDIQDRSYKCLVTEAIRDEIKDLYISEAEVNKK